MTYVHTREPITKSRLGTPTTPQASSHLSALPLSAPRASAGSLSPCQPGFLYSCTCGHRGRRSVWPRPLDTAIRVASLAGFPALLSGCSRSHILRLWGTSGLPSVFGHRPQGCHRRSRLALPGHTFPVPGLNVQEWNGRVMWQVCVCDFSKTATLFPASVRLSMWI